MALGAARRQVIGMVLRETCRLGAAGVAIGLVTAWATTRYVESFLFGIKGNDPVAIGLAVVVLAAASMTAGYVPARRASRIDPIAALRDE